ncbi:endolytic transglycosylase MltG, partial [Patescibacteria group bacterium]|nr:endolytic transglycosylase MltG [Patescibacteria group bacterium]MBU1890824.1 endolytic transglycosylase MltG [Patescibacteria group bacterium]
MRILNIIIGLLIVLVILAGMVFWYFTGLIKAPDKSNEARDVVIVIESGQGVKEIATMLEEEGVIRSARAFETYIWIEGLSAKIIAGQYSLNTGQEVSTIVSIISEGEVVASETEFQVLEGWTAADIARQYGELFSK